MRAAGGFARSGVRQGGDVSVASPLPGMPNGLKGDPQLLRPPAIGEAARADGGHLGIGENSTAHDRTQIVSRRRSPTDPAVADPRNPLLALRREHLSMPGFPTDT